MDGTAGSAGLWIGGLVEGIGGATGCGELALECVAGTGACLGSTGAEG